MAQMEITDVELDDNAYNRERNQISFICEYERGLTW